MSTDLQRFAQELVCASRHVAGPLAFRAWALGRLREFASFDTAVYVPLSHPAGGPAAVNRNRADYLRYYGRYLEQPAYYAPSLERGIEAAAGGGGAYVDTEVYSSAERERLPFFTDIVRPQGITSQIVVAVQFHHRSRASIHLCRHGKVRNFSHDDATRIARLMPALALAQAAFDLSEVAEASSPSVLDRLTQRELTVARLVARGFRNRDIAALLGTSPNTTRNQIATIFRKMQVRTRAALASSMVRPAR